MWASEQVLSRNGNDWSRKRARFNLVSVSITVSVSSGSEENKRITGRPKINELIDSLINELIKRRTFWAVIRGKWKPLLEGLCTSNPCRFEWNTSFEGSSATNLSEYFSFLKKLKYFVWRESAAKKIVETPRNCSPRCAHNVTFLKKLDDAVSSGALLIHGSNRIERRWQKIPIKLLKSGSRVEHYSCFF